MQTGTRRGRDGRPKHLARFTAIRCLVSNTKVLRDRLPVPASREIATDAHLAESGGKMARYREITLDEMTPPSGAFMI